MSRVSDPYHLTCRLSPLERQPLTYRIYSLLRGTAQTGEVVLEVVAQFVFRPGSGQPTLVWLDSVQTVRSTQLSADHTPEAIVDTDGEFVQLTQDLDLEGHSGRSWTTFFPPKIGDLTNGGGSLGLTEAGRSSESQRSNVSPYRTERFFKSEMDSGLENNITAEESGAVPLAPVGPANVNESKQGVLTPAGGMGEGGGDNGIAGDDKLGHVRKNDGPDGGSDRGRNFTLPTESWAHRSAGPRGHYLSGTGGVGARADRSLHEKWPRKRSTGTTMRRDCIRGRLDLRNAAEHPIQWANHSTQATKTGAPESEFDPVGVTGG